VDLRKAISGSIGLSSTVMAGHLLILKIRLELGLTAGKLKPSPALGPWGSGQSHNALRRRDFPKSGPGGSEARNRGPVTLKSWDAPSQAMGQDPVSP